MRSYSIRDLCRQAADPEVSPDALAHLVTLTDGHVARSHRVRLVAALLGNPALSLRDAADLLGAAPARCDRHPSYRFKQGPRMNGDLIWRLFQQHRCSTRQWNRATLKKDDDRLPLPLIRALRDNPAWTLHRLTDPCLARLPDDVVLRVWKSVVWRFELPPYVGPW